MISSKRQIQQQILWLETQQAMLIHREAEVSGFAAHLGETVLGLKEI